MQKPHDTSERAPPDHSYLLALVYREKKWRVYRLEIRVYMMLRRKNENQQIEKMRHAERNGNRNYELRYGRVKQKQKLTKGETKKREPSGGVRILEEHLTAV